MSSSVIKNYFDDPTFSELTILLSDRSVNAHRIVLCRKSEYFKTLLTGHFKESNAKEIKLLEDDPQAVVALLRHIYDLPYQRDGRDGGEKWPVDLNDSVTLWVTAGKYLMKDVQDAATRDIRSLSRYHHNQGVISDVPHFLAALRNIIACTSHEDNARKYMVTACIKNLTLLRKDDEFITLLRECGELGAEIIGDKDLDRALLGSWMCGRMCEKTPEPQCSDCGYRFFVDSAWNQRHFTHWWCSDCEETTSPVCVHCEEEVEWVQRGITGKISA